MLLPICIFLAAYFFIATEKIDKTIAAVLGATAMILTHRISYEAALEKVDLNVIFVLIGMMIVVNILASTGVFEWMSIKLAQRAKGNGLAIMAASTTVVPSDWFDTLWSALDEPPSANPALRARAARSRRVTQR